MSIKSLKVWQKTLIIIACVLAFLGVAVLGAITYFKLPVSSYYKASEKAFVIPDLDDDFVPQGFHYDSENDVFIISGYMSDDDPSPIYLVDRESGRKIKEVDLKKKNGADFTGHSGGVAVYGEYLYVAGSKCIYVYSYTDLLNAGDDSSLTSLGTFSTKVSDTDYGGTSFVTVQGDYLYVGEFYDGGKYLTLDSHKVTTPSGKVNNAIMLKYRLNSACTDTFGFEGKPEAAYSIPDKVQGVAFNGDNIYFSTSYGASFSHIYEHQFAGITTTDTIDMLDCTLPLYHFDDLTLIKDYKIAPMSEEIVFVDNYLYTMCESASNKYIFGKLIGGKWCYKTDLTKMK